MSIWHYVLVVLLGLLAYGIYASRARLAAILDKARVFWREVRVEMKKVSWPSKDELIGNTVVVLAAVVALSIIIGAEDFILGWLVKAVFFRQ